MSDSEEPARDDCADGHDDEPEAPESDPDPDCSSFPQPGGCQNGVDRLACIAKGDKAKADYNETFAEKLQTAKADYALTQEAYRKERDRDRAVVEDLRNQIRHLVERIGCRIAQPRVRRCLDEAMTEVLAELACCPSDGGCCVGDCDFPVEGTDELSVEKLTALITRYQNRIDEAEACFTALKGEPAALAARVEAVKTAVADLTSAEGGDAAVVDLKRLYADALVARWRADTVWGGFEHRHDFVTCLCDALTCWRKGCEAVYQLHGTRAIAECNDKAKEDRCTDLRTKTTDQVLAAYERICGKAGCQEDEQTPPPADDDQDCGCGKHRHDHRGHRHDCGCHHHDCGCHQHD
jgi:hypothetical protein